MIIDSIVILITFAMLVGIVVAVAALPSSPPPPHNPGPPPCRPRPRFTLRIHTGPSRHFWRIHHHPPGIHRNIPKPPPFAREFARGPHRPDRNIHHR